MRRIRIHVYMRRRRIQLSYEVSLRTNLRCHVAESKVSVLLTCC